MGHVEWYILILRGVVLILKEIRDMRGIDMTTAQTEYCNEIKKLVNECK